jgi:hypothetical protein
MRLIVKLSKTHVGITMSEGSKEKRVFTYQDWIGVFISCGALALTSITTYQSSLRVEDNVRVIVRGVPVVSHDANSEEVTVGSGSQWIITNAGNRAVAITNALFFLVKDDKGDSECLKDILAMVQLNLEPFVLQPKQVEIKNLSLRVLRKRALGLKGEICSAHAPTREISTRATSLRLRRSCL